MFPPETQNSPELQRITQTQTQNSSWSTVSLLPGKSLWSFDDKKRQKKLSECWQSLFTDFIMYLWFISRLTLAIAQTVPGAGGLENNSLTEFMEIICTGVFFKENQYNKIFH